jgi:hypothetical protein
MVVILGTFINILDGPLEIFKSEKGFAAVKADDALRTEKRMKKIYGLGQDREF